MCPLTMHPCDESPVPCTGPTTNVRTTPLLTPVPPPIRAPIYSTHRSMRCGRIGLTWCIGVPVPSTGPVTFLHGKASMPVAQKQQQYDNVTPRIDV